MNAPLAPIHSPFGGSVAARVLRCPASVGLVAKVPENLRRSSTYAHRGTALHAAMNLLLDEKETLESLAGKSIGDYVITTDDVETALRPAFTYIIALLDTPGAEFYFERRVVFPTIAGAFGTADLIVRIDRTIHVVDLKFGVGVRVLAPYPDGDDDVINAQLLFYGAAARHSLPEFFAGVENIVLTILQPVSIEPDAEMVSSVAVEPHELDEFVAAYHVACAEALSDAPRLERGPWCRFCAAKPICPEHTSPLLDLAQFTAPTLHDALQAMCSAPAKEAYLQALADGLALFDATKDIAVTLRDQARAALENGDIVPGYALSAGRAERHWRDDERTAIAALERLGLSRDDIIAETMRSPKQVEIRAKARGLNVQQGIQKLVVSRRSGTSLVRAENAHAPAPAAQDVLIRSFCAALENFQGGSEYEYQTRPRS
jgi:hypothetical protein